MLELKNDKGTEHIILWKSKVVYNSKLIPLHGAFLFVVIYFSNKIGMQFNSSPLVVEQNSYASKIVNVYLVYELKN